MFGHLQVLPDDPILGLAAAFRRDPRPDKVDLSVGVYKDATGAVPILESVRAAENASVAAQVSKAYIGIAGDPGFCSGLRKLVFGDALDASLAARLRAAQTPGGCAALFTAAAMIREANPGATVWISEPSWSNHAPIFEGVGLRVRYYPYYSTSSCRLLFDDMLEALSAAQAQDVVVLHGCCHNPSGADPDVTQWQRLVDLLVERSLLPLVDLAYAGLGAAIDDDVAGLRALVAAVDEAFVAVSCSKNFGLYRDRVGMLAVLASGAAAADAAESLMLKRIRCSYSMPPAHGAAVVSTLLSTDGLSVQWQSELSAMRDRITAMRTALHSALGERGVGNLADLEGQRGMFSLLAIDRDTVQRMRDGFGVYVVGSGRINVCGLNDTNVGRVADAIAGATPS